MGLNIGIEYNSYRTVLINDFFGKPKTWIITNIIVPFFNTSKTSFLIPPFYDTSGNSFSPFKSKLLAA